MKPLRAEVAEPRDAALARTLRDNGVKNALRIVIECRHRHDGVIPVSLGVALQEQESNGRNIFGADTNAPFAHQPVTKERVLQLVEHVREGGTSNDVGPLQLTPAIHRGSQPRRRRVEAIGQHRDRPGHHRCQRQEARRARRPRHLQRRQPPVGQGTGVRQKVIDRQDRIHDLITP
jgi:hypothetical protein